MFIRTVEGGYTNLAHFTRVFLEDHSDLGRYYIVGDIYGIQQTLGVYDSKEEAETELKKIFEHENVYVLHDLGYESQSSNNALSFDIA